MPCAPRRPHGYVVELTTAAKRLEHPLRLMLFRTSGACLSAERLREGWQADEGDVVLRRTHRGCGELKFAATGTRP